MSAETKATRAVVYARGGPVSEPDMHTREYDRVVAEPSLNTSAVPRGARGEKIGRQAGVFGERACVRPLQVKPCKAKLEIAKLENREAALAISSEQRSIEKAVVK